MLMAKLKDIMDVAYVDMEYMLATGRCPTCGSVVYIEMDDEETRMTCLNCHQGFGINKYMLRMVEICKEI